MKKRVSINGLGRIGNQVLRHYTYTISPKIMKLSLQIRRVSKTQRICSSTIPCTEEPIAASLPRAMKS